MNLRIINRNQLKINGLQLQIIVSFAASLVTVSEGIFIGWSAQKISDMTKNTSNSTSKMTLSEASIIGTMSLYLLPVTIPVSIICADRLGRKWTIMLGSLCVFCSWVILSLKNELTYIYLGVVIRGLGGFIIYTIIPIYIAEIAQTDIRGLLCSFTPIFMNLGILLGYICISVTSLANIAIMGAVFATVMLSSFIFAPQSPYFLLMKNKQESANKSLVIFRNTPNVTSEMKDMKTVIERNENEKNSLKEFFTDKINIKISFIAFLAVVFQQFSGIDTILIFLEIIVQEFNSNISNSSSTTIFAIAKFCASGIALILMDKLGRRILMITSCTITSFALFLLGLYFYLKDVAHTDISSVSWLPLSLLVMYILGYNIGLGAVPFILASEMFPIKFKSYGVVGNHICFSVSMIFINKIFTLLKENYGFYASFWTLAGFTIVGIVYSYFIIHETKGKTLKQILIELECN